MEGIDTARPHYGWRKSLIDIDAELASAARVQFYQLYSGDRSSSVLFGVAVDVAIGVHIDIMIT